MVMRHFYAHNAFICERTTAFLEDSSAKMRICSYDSSV